MSNIICSICWEKFQKEDILLATSCGHLYHSDCLQQWMLNSPTCPQCRVDCCSSRQFFLTFDGVPSDEERAIAAGGGAVVELNEVIRNGTQIMEELYNELYPTNERTLLSARTYHQEIQILKKKLSECEHKVEMSAVKDKIMNEEFHYKMQDLKTEYHYKLQSMQKVKHELMENLAKATNAEAQLRNSLDDSLHMEDKLRKNLMQYSTRIIDLESEKAKVQSQLEASERHVRWLEFKLGGREYDSSVRSRGSPLESHANPNNSGHLRGANDNDYENGKAPLGNRLRKLYRGADDSQLELQNPKDSKQQPLKENCILL